METKQKVNMNEVRNFAKKINHDKKEILENSFEEMTKLTKDLTELKLQNEEMEIVIGEVIKEKDRLEDKHQGLCNSYDTLLAQYTETRKLLHDSHDQNVKMSEILERMRENEACLVSEIQKLRKFGSFQESNKQQGPIRMDSVANLEKEVKFWQNEAEKLSQIIELNDKKLQLTTQTHSQPTKKTSKQIKRYNKVVNRSHSVENSQRKSKELEFEKLKLEKVQMKNLLNELEGQVAEIQNNVIKINDERQRYKELYYCNKDKSERIENLNVDLERQVCDLSNENSKLTQEKRKLSVELDELRQDNRNLKENNEDLLAEITKMKVHHEQEVKTFETKMSSLAKENHDIGVRSNNLKNSIISLEIDFKQMEQELQRKCTQIKEYLLKIGTLEKSIDEANKVLNERLEYIHVVTKTKCTLEETIKKMQKNEEQLCEKLDIKTKESNTHRIREKEKDETISNMKSSFSAHVVKLENQILNADQIISSKIKLITSLELKVANNDKELKLKDEDILCSRKLLSSKDHELETVKNRFEENIESKKYLEQQLEDVSTQLKSLSCEVINLNEIIRNAKESDTLLKNEIKTLKESLNRKEDHMQIMESQLERQERELPVKIEEVARLKKVISHLENEIDLKESHIGSLLSLLESKEEKFKSIQSDVEEKDRMVKEYVDQLNSIDDCVIQSTARNNALENEIEKLQNNNIRLTRQKEHLGQMLSSRNITIGQLQAQLADKSECRYIEKISIVDDFPEYDKNDEETFHSPSRQSRKSRNINGNDSFTNLNRMHKNYVPSKSINETHNVQVFRNRSHSNDDRQ